MRLQREFAERGFTKPQYVSCQHHVLDRVLKLVIDYIFPGVSSSPNLHYSFVQAIIDNYTDLKIKFVNNGPTLEYDNLGWRDDMKLLYLLCESYIFYKKMVLFHKSNCYQVCHLFIQQGGILVQFMP